MSSASQRVIESRLLARDDAGNITETIDEMYRRVAVNTTNSEEEANLIYDIISSGRFLFNSPTFVNAGRKLGQLSACFVLPVEDSMEGIFDAVKWGAIIHKTGGGTGYSFSRLRPAGAKVISTGREASGVVSFMDAFDAATQTIKQGGVRRGANMAVLSVNHPEIEMFINAKKSDLTKLTNFNMSIAITDDFIRNARRGVSFKLEHPKMATPKEVDAMGLLDKMVDASWATGEPGFIFMDEMERWNPTPHIGKYEATNPCGEQVLLPFESCNLGSINLSKFVDDEGKVDWKSLEMNVFISVRALDNIIDKNRYIIPQIEAITKGNRKIGLGVMGFADMLIKMGIIYGSEKSIRLAKQVMSFIQFRAFEASASLAQEKGAFPNYQEDRMMDILDYRIGRWQKRWPSLGYNRLLKKVKKYGLRNATVTTIAPTGTLSLVADCSSGIEPVFAFSFKHSGLDGKVGEIVHPLYLAYKESHPAEGMPDYFIDAHHVAIEDHLLVQAAFQEYTCNAVSKTINLPESATRDQVKGIILKAYDLGLKGLTVYRDGCRTNVLNAGLKKKDEEKKKLHRRGRKLSGDTVCTPLSCGKLYTTMNFSSDNDLMEVFLNLGKSGGCVKAFMEALGRMISLALRNGVPVESVAKNLRDISCPKPTFVNGKMAPSCIDVIVGDILTSVKDKGGKVIKSVESIPGVPTCPDCGGKLIQEEGCAKCHICGYSECK